MELVTAEQQRQRTQWSTQDLLLAAALSLVAAAYLHKHVARGTPPEEDASMLLRYSEHLANGNGITWNVGEHPVEGATDFLFMVAVGLLGHLVTNVVTAARLLLSAAHVISVGLMYLLTRYLYRTPVPVALFVSLCLACGPAAHLISSVFSAPLWALCALVAWASALVMVERGITQRRALLFSVTGLLLGLIRPEGNLIALYMLVAALLSQPRERLRLFITFTVVFTILGGAYFVWRWHYFGYPLPNPFYVKHRVHMTPLKKAFEPLNIVLMPLFAALGVGLATRVGRTLLFMLLTVLLPFTLMWTVILQANNGVHRFQYVLIPIVLLSLAGMVTSFHQAAASALATHTALRRGVYGAALSAALLALLYFKSLDNGLYVNPGAYNLAMRLRPLAGRGYSLVSTEAGTLPFFSEWRAVDALGLNDAYIAHHKGQITEEYLDRYKPQLILYKAWKLGPVGPLSARELALEGDDFSRRVPQVATALREYATKHHYTLAAVYANQYCDFHYIWVRSDGPDAAYILSAVRDHPYGYQETGLPTFDFRAGDLTTPDTCHLTVE